MCNNNRTCQLCKNLVISQGVTFADGALVINLPQRNYTDGCKYCVVVGQTIPADTTIGALVYFTIGTDTTQYPVTKRNCAQLTACGIRTRTKYPVRVDTNATGGAFRLLANASCEPTNNLESLPAAPAAPVAPATGE